MKIRGVSRSIVSAFLIAQVGCASGPNSSYDGRMLERIVRAEASGSPGSAAREVKLVLDDVVQRSYRFGQDTRTTAIQFVSHFPNAELVKLVDEIARLELDRHDEGRQTLDGIAVADALRALTRMNHATALERNRARLGSLEPFVFAAAVYNLQLLEDWSSTSRIQDALGRMELTVNEVVEIRATLLFLQLSPATSRDLCGDLDRISERSRTFREGPAFYSDLVDVVGVLEARLECLASRP